MPRASGEEKRGTAKCGKAKRAKKAERCGAPLFSSTVVSRRPFSELRNSFRVLELRQRFQRLFGGLGQHDAAIVDLQIVERHGHQMLTDAEEAANRKNGIRAAITARRD